LTPDQTFVPAPEGEKTYFYYLEDALERGARLEVLLGDGRQTLKADPLGRKLERYYHIIVLDAFQYRSTAFRTSTGALELHRAESVQHDDV